MTGPPEGQEEAPRCVSAHRGAKNKRESDARTVAEPRRSVKHGRACNAYPTWRTWPTWLRLEVVP